MIIDEVLQAQKRAQMLLFTPAANLIKEYGWSIGESKGYTMVGAMCEVQGFTLDTETIDPLEEIIEAVGPLLAVRCNLIEPIIRYCTWRDIGDWEYAEGRTKEHVLHVLLNTVSCGKPSVSQDAAHAVRL